MKSVVFTIRVLLVVLSLNLANAKNCTNSPHKCVCSHTTATCKKLTSVPTGIPEKTTVLHMNGCQISSLRDNSFSNLSHLTQLNLSSNVLFKISPNAFKGLVSLKTLLLDENNLKSLDMYLVADLKSLTELNLTSNKISSVSQHALDALRNLQKLDLSRNEITTIHDHAFTKLRNLKILKLNNNSLRIAKKTWFTGPQMLKVSMENNPWTCNCSMRFYYDWLGNTSMNQLHVLASLNIYCSLLKHKLRKVSASHFTNCSGGSHGAHSTISHQTTTTTKSPTTTTTTKSPTTPTTKSPTTTTTTKSPTTPTTKSPTITTKSPTATTKSPTATTKPHHHVNETSHVLSINKGSSAALKCVHGRGALSWKKNGKSILLNSHHYQLKKNSLIIKNFTHSDVGKYCCFRHTTALKHCTRMVISKIPAPNSGTSPAMSAFIVIAVIVVFIIGIFFCHRKLRERRRKRYGLLNDETAFQPAYDDASVRPSQELDQGREVSEEYV